MTHPNEEMLRAGYESFAKGDMDTVMGLFSDDILWHAPGRNPLSGDYRGKQEVGNFFGTLAERSNGTFHLDVHDVLANDDHAVGLVRLRGERNGKQLDARDVQVWHVKDGKITEFWSNIQDQYEFDEFWA